MTTNSARQQAQQAPSAQDGREQALGADIQIPVLIRLPDVSGSVVAASAASDAHIVWQNSPLPSEIAPVAEETAAEPLPEPKQTAAKQVSSQTANATASEPDKNDTRSFWSDFSLPAPVINAAVALSLIAVFIVAYMVIVGGGGAAKEVVESKPTVDDERVARHVHTEGELADGTVDAMMPAIPEMPPASPASAQPGELTEETTPVPAATPTAQPPAKEETETPGSGLNAGQLASQDTREVEQPEFQSKPEAADSERTRLAAQSGAASIQQTEFKSPAQPPMPETDQPTGNSRSAEIENRWAMGFSNEAPRASDDGAETARGGFYDGPLAPRDPVADTNPVANSPTYPSTNPVSFQYPANYHEHLIGTNSPETNRPIPWADEASAYGRQPSTARMRPRMDAPPIR